MNGNNSNHQNSFNFLRMLSETSDSDDGMENSTFPDFNDISNQPYNFKFTPITQTRTQPTSNHENGLTKNIIHSSTYNPLSTPLSQPGFLSPPLSPTNSVTKERKTQKEKLQVGLFQKKSCATNTWNYSMEIMSVGTCQDNLK